MLNRLKHVFSIDLRTLACFRIGLGLIILADLIIRTPDLQAHYTNFGLLPLEQAMAFFNNIWSFSFYFINGSAWFQALGFLATGILAIMLIAGHHTRAVTIGLLFMIISVQNRNPILLNGGDNLLGVLLFWAIFLPLGARCSIDAARNPTPPTDNQHFSIATIAILIQAMSLYLFTAILKTGADWWPDGTAVHYALQLDQFAKPFGIWLREQPFEILQALTYAVLALEFLAPILIFTPFFSTPVRLAILGALISMHLGFHFGLRIGWFSFISIVSISNFIPGAVWDWLSNRIHTPKMPSLLKNRIQKLPPKPIKLHNNVLTNVIVGALSLYVLCWNIASVPGVPYGFSNDPLVRMPAYLFRLDQKWSMFAPRPFRDDGWFVIRGELKDGTVVDVRHQTVGEPDINKPVLASADYASFRWRKYMRRLWEKRYSKYRLQYGQYLCRDWNSQNIAESQKLNTFTIDFYREDTPPPGQPNPTPEKIRLWEHFCFKVSKT